MDEEIKARASNFPTEIVSGRPEILTQVCSTPKPRVITIVHYTCPELGDDNFIVSCNDITAVNLYLVLCDSF